MTLREMLARIQWDREFGAGEFVLACYDRVSGELERIPLDQVRLRPGQHLGFEAGVGDLPRRFIPFHRVREITRDGVLIWERRVTRPGPS